MSTPGLYTVGIALLAVGIAACAGNQRESSPSVSDAKTFLDTANETMKRLEIKANQVGWVAQTYITEDTEALSAKVNQELIDQVARFAKESTRFNQIKLPPDERRQLDLLKLSLVMATPSDSKEAEELTG